MSPRPSRCALPALLALVVALSGCGGSQHHGRTEPPDPDLNGPQQLPMPLAAAIVPNPSPQAVARQSASASGAILAFATVYARSSLAGLTGRESTLLAYSSAAYAAHLRATYSQARAQTARALPDGAEMTGAVEALALRPGTASRRTGLLAIGQSLQLPGEASQPPVILHYMFTLQHSAEGWRVASFAAQLGQ
jgi:hypothetical protein